MRLVSLIIAKNDGCLELKREVEMLDQDTARPQSTSTDGNRLEGRYADLQE